jgi:hypothetical protein
VGHFHLFFGNCADGTAQGGERRRLFWCLVVKCLMSMHRPLYAMREADRCDSASNAYDYEMLVQQWPRGECFSKPLFAGQISTQMDANGMVVVRLRTRSIPFLTTPTSRTCEANLELSPFGRLSLQCQRCAVGGPNHEGLHPRHQHHVTLTC